MEPKARHIVIGAFTVGILVFALLFALWLAKLDKYQGSQSYVVHFKEGVTGLSKGSTVSFSGIKVGEVLALSLDPQDPRQVYALITVDRQVPIREGVEARLQLTGITGQSLIALKGGEIQKTLLLNSAPIHPEFQVPVIEATPSPMAALLEDGQSVLSNLTEISYSLKTIFSVSNVKTLENILGDVQSVTSTMAEAELVRELESMIQAYRQVAEKANGLLNQEGKALFAQASKAMENVEKSSRQIQGLLKNNEGNLEQGLHGLKELAPAIIEFKRSFSTLQNILRSLEEKPASYLIEGNRMKGFTP